MTFDLTDKIINALDKLPKTIGVLDISRLNQVVVDTASKTLRVGAGARLQAIHSALTAYGLALPAGSCPGVGVAGLTLGGGVGLLSRKWGLTADQLLSLKIVKADGQEVEASPHKNSDLFLACRGGGGHFGVATEFLFRVRSVPQVPTFSVHWSPAQAAEAIDAWQAYAPRVPDELTCHLSILGAAGRDLTSIHCGGQVTGAAEGEGVTESHVAELLKPLIDKVRPTSVKIHVCTFAQAVAHFAGSAETTPIYFKGSSDFAKTPLNTAGIRTLIDQVSHLPQGGAAVIFDALGGAVARIPISATAFPHRTMLYGIQYYGQWPTPDLNSSRTTIIRNLRETMTPYFSGSAYANYADADIPDASTAYYGPNYARLQQIKSKVDPHNLFGELK